MESLTKVYPIQQRGRDKKIHLEFLRILGIILVIFNHTGSHGFFLYAISEFSPFYSFYFFCSIACKVAVPLFWMISGALLIKKEESLSTLYKKRILKIVLVLIVFSFIQYLFFVFENEARTFYIRDFLKTLYSGQLAMAYWYIYAYIGVLLVLPFVRKMAKNMERKEYLYLFGLFLTICGALPILEYLLWQGRVGMNNLVRESIFSQALIYLMTGHYLENMVDEKELSGKRAGIIMFLGFIAIVISCFITKFMTNITGLIGETEAQTFYNSLIFVPSYAIFYLSRFCFGKYGEFIDERVKKVIITFGGASFGAILIENLWRERLETVFYFLKPYCKIFPSCIIWVLLTWVCATGTILILKKLPLMRKLI